ncbi:UNVERIFIED_CONTAM: hypothetical protein Sradi_7036400 [Sesamum radiatum]|uniref:Uncharacterized protein n=1 Tax=Sesamum radiatum TaxID=300843 RepID=A0AAW2J9K3_SESRA
MEDPFSAVIPFLKAPQELVAVQEMLPQGPQNPPLEVVEGPSTFNDLRRLEVDSRLGYTSQHSLEKYCNVGGYSSFCGTF